MVECTHVTFGAAGEGPVRAGDLPVIERHRMAGYVRWEETSSGSRLSWSNLPTSAAGSANGPATWQG